MNLNRRGFFGGVIAALCAPQLAKAAPLPQVVEKVPLPPGSYTGRWVGSEYANGELRMTFVLDSSEKYDSDLNMTIRYAS